MRVLLAIVAFLWLCTPALGQQPAASTAAAPPGPRELYQSLNAIRVESNRTYYARELVLRRDVVKVFLTEGKLAFLQPSQGKVTGAVFTGRGRVIAVPRDPIERRSLARFVGPPLLDLTFRQAYLRFTDDTAQELLRQLERNESVAVDDPAFGQDWNPAVATLNPWHSLRALTDLVSDNRLPYFYAGVQTDSHGPLDVMVDQRREEPVGIGQPRWIDGIGYYDLWASFRPQGDEKWRAPFDPVAYTVETTIRSDLELEGNALVELKAARGGERMAPLELSRQLRVESIIDAQGRSLVFFQNEDMKRDEVSARGNDLLYVVLHEAAPAGESLRLRFRYKGRVISDAGNGAYFVGARGIWYPNLGGFDHFATFDLSFRWPRTLELVANGKKISSGVEGEWKTGRWVSEKPVPIAGFNLGNYEHHRVQRDGLTIDVYANRRLESAIADRMRQGSASSTRAVVTGRRRIIVPILPDLPPPSPAAHLDELGKEVLEAIRFNESLSVPFPFQRLAVAQIPGSFGQGWPGLLYLSTLSFLSPGSQTRIGASERTQQQYLDLVPPHEVAHQWWGNLVGWPTYRDQWIHEALANYLALLFAESRKPGSDVMKYWLDAYRQRLAEKEPGSDARIGAAGPLVLGRRLMTSRSSAAYGAVIYGKGTWVIHMLRMMLRDEKAAKPDARFVALLRALVEGYSHRGLTTADLQAEAEKLMTPEMDLEGGRSLDWFFDQWVYGVELPRYSVDFKSTRRGQKFIVSGTLKQQDVNSVFVSRVPLYAQTARGRLLLLGTVVASGEETRFRLTTTAPPRKIVIDPHQTILGFTQ